MKEETNNEIDLMLRRLGRHPGVVTRLDEDHLDADELSAYAENALPAAARARYTEHLAECSQCRELIVGLSSSVGVVEAAKAAQSATPSALRRFLTSVFSPIVLRYSIPALGVLVVAFIGVFVLRIDQGRSVSELARGDQLRPEASPGERSALVPNSSNSVDNNRTPSAPPGRELDGQSKSAPDSSAASPPPNTPPAVSVTAEVKPGATTPGKAEQQPVVAGATPTAAAIDAERNTVTVEASKESVDKRTMGDLPAQKTTELAKDQGRRDEEKVTTEAGAAKNKDGSFMTSPARSRGNARRAPADNDDNAETRSVAGRRFRKQQGVWVDTAYESSRSPLTFPRGSEQFRVLVADEPAIKEIADKLDGEIIVVWKGQVYRIR